MSEEDAEKLFLQEKPTLALLFIGSMEKTYASVISKEIDSTFAHTTRILSKMEECGLIGFTYEGRIKYVKLTEYGIKVEAALKECRNILRQTDPKIVEETTQETAGNDSEAPENSEERYPETENVKELDPVNTAILEKIQALHSRIETIHKEAVEQGTDRNTVSRKLGPYTRDIKKLQNMIEEAEGTSIDEMVTAALDETSELLESYLRP